MPLIKLARALQHRLRTRVLVLVLLAGWASTAPLWAAQNPPLEESTLADAERRVGLPYAAWPGADLYPTADAVDLVRKRSVTLDPCGLLGHNQDLGTMSRKRLDRLRNILLHLRSIENHVVNDEVGRHHSSSFVV